MYRVRRCGIAARVGIVIAAIGAIAAMALPGEAAAATPSPSPSSTSTASASHTTCAKSGMSTTCTGTYSGDHAWNPWTGQTIAQTPVVTVSQTKNLTDQVVNVNWRYFTPTLAPGALGVAPNPTAGGRWYEANIFECKGTDPPIDATHTLADSCYEAYPGGPSAPDGLPNAFKEPFIGGITFAPGASGKPETLGGPASATGGDPANWAGSAQFHIEAGAEQNSMLGCDVSTPCSLVIDPNFGGNAGACETHSRDFQFGGILGNALDAGLCQVADRIVVPLSFAPTPANCPQRNPEFFAEGSPMMERQISQWESGWCNGSAPVSLNYNSSVSEDSARSAFLQPGPALSSRIDMAMVTLPPDASASGASSRKFTYAPLANSGVAMAYYLDDAQTGQPINRVVLDPTLAAKLTTESYSLEYDCTQAPVVITGPPGTPQWPPTGKGPSPACDPAVKGNPNTVFDDGEFLALNKDCQPASAAAGYACGASDFPGNAGSGSKNAKIEGVFLPTVPGGFSDMTFQLTDWTAADADAAGFLAGKPDLWGMHVNTNYKNVPYPSQFFQTLDPGIPSPPDPIVCTTVKGKTTCTGEEAGTVNTAWNFVTGLDDISTRLLGLQPNADLSSAICTDPNQNCTSPAQFSYPAVGVETPTQRDLFSELDLGHVGAYQFPATAMVNASGSAVAPTQASVEAAVRDMKTNADGITQYADKSSTDPNAYPLSMVDYAMVPTCGLSSSEASAIADVLTKAATTGQSQGVAPGNLAPGYYPLTSAQKAQTLKAAQEVKTQDCKTVRPDTTVSGHPSVNDVSPNNGPHAAGPAAGAPGTGAGANGAGAGGTGAKHAGAPGSGGPGAAGPGSAARAQTAAFGQKSPDSGLTGILLLIVMIIGGLAVVGGPAAWAVTVTGKWPAVAARTRSAWAWAPSAWSRVSPALARVRATRTWRA